MRQKRCCFFGHRSILSHEKVFRKLLAEVESAVIEGYDEFFIGHHGDFDRMALDACRQIREKYPQITITVILTSPTQSTITVNEEKGKILYTRPRYEGVETMIFDIEEIHYKKRISFSNRRMIENSDLAICYVREDKAKSGAKTSLHYAQKTGKEIRNLYDLADHPFYQIPLNDFQARYKYFLKKR